MPLPLAMASSAKTRRTSVASTPSDAAIPLQTPATTRSSSLRLTSSWSRAARPPSGCVRVSPAAPIRDRLVADFEIAEADRRIDDETPLGGLELPPDHALVNVPAALVATEDLQVPAVHLPRHGDCHVLRHLHHEVADTDPRRDPRLAGRQLELAEVDVELADPQPVF